MLGAKIGKNCEMDLNATIAEFDLIEINDFVKIEKSTIRGFGLSNNAMILGKISNFHPSIINSVNCFQAICTDDEKAIDVLLQSIQATCPQLAHFHLGCRLRMIQCN